MSHKAVPASYLILRKGEKVLLMRRQGSGYYDGWYSVPAGHVEEGELPVEALIREAKEEIGITVAKENLSQVYTMYRTKHDETGDRADYFFEAIEWQGNPFIHEPNKCDDIRWFSLDALPEKMMHHVRAAILDIQDGKRYAELGRGEVWGNPTK